MDTYYNYKCRLACTDHILWCWEIESVAFILTVHNQVWSVWPSKVLQHPPKRYALNRYQSPWTVDSTKRTRVWAHCSFFRYGFAASITFHCILQILQLAFSSWTCTAATCCDIIGAFQSAHPKLGVGATGIKERLSQYVCRGLSIQLPQGGNHLQFTFIHQESYRQWLQNICDQQKG